MRTVNTSWLAVAVAGELVSIAAFALLQRRMLGAAGAWFPLRRMTGLAFAANAISATLPGGAALSIGYVARRLRGWGASGSAAAFALVASGVLSTATYAALAVGTTLGSSATLPTLGGTALVLGVVLVPGLRRPAFDLAARAARRAVVLFGRLRRRPPSASLSSLDEFLAGLRSVRVRPADWAAGLVFAGANWVADLACLAASCRAVGVGAPGLVAITCGYLAGKAASNFSFLPGGFGATDVAIAVALTRAGAESAGATAAVLCYRLISFGLVVAVGWLVHLVTWHATRRRLGITRIRPGAGVPSVIDNSSSTPRGGSDVTHRTFRIGRSRRPAGAHLGRRGRHAGVGPLPAVPLLADR